MGVYTINIPSTFVYRHSASTKHKAIEMRQNGCTYSEILKEIKVAKSTLSLWLREVGLSKVQVQRITERRKAARKKGGWSKHETAVKRREVIYDISADQIGTLHEKEIWLLAVMAYWAEGGKEKKYSRFGSSMDFSNTDPRMLRVFVYWLTHIQGIKFSDIRFEIYIHENNAYRINEVQKYWAHELSVDVDRLQTVRFKNHKINTNRKNIGVLYNGLIRVKVVASSTLVRQLEGWAQGIDRIIKQKIYNNS